SFSKSNIWQFHSHCIIQNNLLLHMEVQQSHLLLTPQFLHVHQVWNHLLQKIARVLGSFQHVSFEAQFFETTLDVCFGSSHTHDSMATSCFQKKSDVSFQKMICMIAISYEE